MRTVDFLQGWKEPEGVSEWGATFEKPVSPAWDYYINVNIHPDDLIVLFRMIFPAFVEVGDCILLQANAEGHTESNLINFRNQAGSSEVFERQFNVLKIYDLFSHRTVAHESSFEQAAELLKQAWQLTLAQLFPQKQFEVLLTNTDKDYGPTLTFFSPK